ncbi:uncharacterized protein K452DRAFT_286223 [Aplosporella prunicola CBS 121167]|uniref:Uncharacterized protein n=1 Tax=Aplosporella prunicola CBS 121167 TaxID=1176127 RepID=A0A6A6BIE5_9PEZI|nr:uncharacterized protein K452DRAFT_286223 [Aplosporella prunicola CBS 121167]KAF2143398.1 hypothetical protein K452DRAFT_286223 [Aplosporella prunicola CBS 121167]
MAATHRTKRPYQPSITSYFARADAAAYDSNSPVAPPHQGLTPLPANVQASLLNVGMRVRKSVPEGYRTHKTLPTSANDAISYNGYTGPTNRPAELLPFCGIHKVGGHTTQPGSAPVDAYGPVNYAAHDFAVSSQASSNSNLSPDAVRTPLPSANKRRFLEEDDDEEMPTAQPSRSNALFALNTNIANFADDDLQVSPCTTYPVSHTSMPNLSSARPLARPKSKRKGVSALSTQRRGALQGDDVPVIVDDDFDEADFLQPYEDVEVEMGGV